MGTFEHEVDDLRIIPASGGVFEVDVDGDTIFSKKTLGRHAKPGEIMGLLNAR